jgi:YHS domain-containing protein
MRIIWLAKPALPAGGEGKIAAMTGGSMSFVRALLGILVLVVAVPAQAQQSLPVALKGNDPVSYFNPGRPAKGAARINYDFDESRYLFSSAKNKALFAANPDRYAPQFSGLCATGLSMGMKTEADPNVFLVKDGKLYVFSSVEARQMVEKDPTLLKKAQESWQHRK